MHRKHLFFNGKCVFGSNKGVKVKELTLYFYVVLKTIFEWFNLWEENGCIGILHKPDIGRKAKLKDISSEIIEDIVKKYPRNLKGVIAERCAIHHVEISVKTLQRHLKKLNFTWRIVRKSLKSKRNQLGFSTKKAQIEQLEVLANANYLDLFYYDESHCIGSPI